MTTEITKILSGFKQFSENPYQDSIKFLKEYIEVEPSSEAYFELGKALFLNGDYDESIQYLERSDDFKKDAYLGLDYYRKRDFESAAGHFKAFLKQKQNETILTYLMLCHEENGEIENAVICGERLLEINPEKDSIKPRLIDHHFTLKQYQKSLDYINELNDREYRYKKALALFNLERYDEAISEAKSLKTPEAYKLIARSYEKLNKPSKAVRYMFRSYELDENTETLFEIADFYSKNSEHDRSMHVLRRILEEDPQNERCLERIVRDYRENGQSHLAVEYCKTLLEVNDKNIEGYVTLADAHYLMKNPEKSFEIIEKGMAIDPKSVDLWKQKAWANYTADHEQFKRDYEQVIRLDPNNTRSYILLIEEYLWDDETDKAHRCYERLLLYNPTFSTSFEEIAANIAKLKEETCMYEISTICYDDEEE